MVKKQTCLSEGLCLSEVGAKFMYGHCLNKIQKLSCPREQFFFSSLSLSF